MKKLIILAIVFSLILLLSLPVSANTDNPGNSDNENRPTTIVEYGKGKDAGFVKITHIHYAKSINNARPAKTDACYKVGKFKWTNQIQYSIQESMSPALSETIATSASTWDQATSRTLFNGVFPTSGKTWGDRDYVNLVTYGDYPNSGVIAVTRTWYSLLTRTYVESDILFDTDFGWSTDQTLNTMDLQNIATHEIGHTLGLSDLYTTSCKPVTMYGYSWYGDIEKRTLETPDIIGLQKLYGV